MSPRLTSTARKTSTLRMLSRPARRRILPRRWWTAKWRSSMKKSAFWSSPSSRNRPCRLRSSLRRRSASSERTSACAVSHASKWATRARQWPAPSLQNRNRSKSGAPNGCLFFCLRVGGTPSRQSAGRRRYLMTAPAFKRVLLKLSGEALAANQGFGVDTARIHEVAAELADVHKLGVQLAIVVGGVNFFRGVAYPARDMARVSADHLGISATPIHPLSVQHALQQQKVYKRVQ